MAEYIKSELKGDNKSEFADIGDWSICSKVCGGGFQMKSGCTKPIGGFKCTKKPVKLKKSCNTQPCKEGQGSDPNNAWKFKQPTITLPVQLESR